MARCSPKAPVAVRRTLSELIHWKANLLVSGLGYVLLEQLPHVPSVDHDYTIASLIFARLLHFMSTL